MNQDKGDQKKRTVFETIKVFFSNLTRTQVIGFLATVNLLLLFSAWLYVPILSYFSNIPLLGSAVSPYINLPETAFSLDNTVTTLETTFNQIVDTFEVKEEHAKENQQFINEINLVSTLLGIDLKENGISLDDIRIEEGNLLFDDQDVQDIRAGFLLVNSIVDPVVGGIVGLIILCLVFDLYAAITAFKKKKVTVGTFSAFIIQGVVILAVFISCLVINTAVQQQIFFINKTVSPSFWAWIVLVVSIVGFYLSLKEYRANKVVVEAKDEASDSVVLSEALPVADELTDSEQSIVQ